MKYLSTLAIAVLFAFTTQHTFAQNVGIGENNPGSRFTVKGNLGVGGDYSTLPAPVNGLIIEGRVGVGTSSPDTSSILDLTSTSKGVLIPRMTTVQRNAINVSDSAASQGLMIFNITTKCIESYIGTSWQPIGCGCTSPPGMPSAFLTSVSPVCQEGSGYLYSITEIAGASSYIWTLPTGATIANGSGTSSITVSFASNANSGTQAISVAANNSCGTSPALSENITVNQIPVITSSPSNATICGVGASYTGNTSFSVTATGTSLTYQWQVNTGSGFSNITNGGIYSNATTSTLNLTAATPSYSGYQYQCVVSGACSPAATSSTATLTVNTVPSVTNSSTASICSGTGTGISLTASVSSTFTWTLGTITGSITGATASNGGTISQTLTDPSSTASGTVPYIVVPTSTTGSCVGNSSTITVTVNPAPAVTTSNAETICNGTGTGISLTASIASSFSWTLGTITGSITGASAGSGSSISQTLSDGSNSASGTVPYIVVPVSTSNSCTGNATTITVTVNPTPVVTNAPSESICSGTGTGISLTASASSTFAWTLGTNTGGITTPAAGSGSAINQTLTNPSNSTAGSIVYNVTPTASSCAGSAYPITVTVNPIPAVTNSTTAGTCSGTSPNITLTASAASTFAWTLGTITGGITGASASNGSAINQTLTDPSNTASGTVPYMVVPTSTTGSCTGSSTTITVTVNPAPAVTNSNTATICSGTGPNISLTAGIASSFTWTVGTITGSITGASSGSGSTINQTLTNPGNSAAGTVPYIVTPTSTANSCVGSAYTITVTVNPTPTITPTPSSPAICSGTAPGISLSSSASGTTYTWSVAQGTGISGGSNCSSSCGSTIAQTLSNSSNTTSATATYTITGSANSCTASTTATVTVNPVPAITATPPATSMCSGATTSIALNSSLSGTTYTWSVAQGTGISGGSNCSSSCGNTIAQTLANSSNATSATATYTITGTESTHSCSASITSVVTVNPIPTITATPSTPSICSGNAPSISLSSSATGTTYTWGISQASGVSGGNNCASSCGSIISDVLSNTNSTSATATYTITGTASSCTATTSAVVTVNPLPAILSLTAGSSSFCLNSSTSLTASASGGSGTYTSYAWTGSGLANATTTVVGNTATPTASGSQTYTVAVTDNNGCQSSTGSTSVTVNALPTITASAAAASVAYSTSSQNTTLAYSATTGTPTTYAITWSSAGHTAGLVDEGSTSLPASPITVPVAASVAPGTYTGTLVVTNGNGCSSTGSSFTLTINSVTLDANTGWKQAASQATSFTITTTVANELIVIVCVGGGNGFAFTAGGGNFDAGHYVKVDGNAATKFRSDLNGQAAGQNPLCGGAGSPAGTAIYVFYYVAPTFGSGNPHTITTSASGTAPNNSDYAVFAAAFIKSSGATFSGSNLYSASLDSSNVGSTSSGSPASLATGTTNMTAGCYLIAVSMNQNTQTSGGSNAFTWTNVSQTPFGGGAATINLGNEAWGGTPGTEQMEGGIAGGVTSSSASQTVTEYYSNTGQCANLLKVFWISQTP